MKWFPILGVLVFLSVQCHPVGPPPGSPDYGPIGQRSIATAPPNDPLNNSTRGISVSTMLRQVNLRTDMVRKGTFGRRSSRSMSPRYITIHSTQNYSADASRHALALKRGALRTGQRPGYLIWHFTVDDTCAIQHQPTTEQGIHADFDGPGNHLSIGIEMCEHRGCSRARTIDRTAKLTAALMKQKGIPLRNVVPHYHWPRKGKSPAHKNCPHFLLDNGRPGKKWKSFLAKVEYEYKRLE